MEMLNLSLLIPALITTLVAILGWYVVHCLNQRRDRENKRRDLRIQFLIDAYRRLERASNRPQTFDNDLELESAIADIQLFGSVNQVNLAEQFALDIAAKSNASTNELLAELRVELRGELKLQKINPDITFLRISKK
jgi:hypothetical protein